MAAIFTSTLTRVLACALPALCLAQAPAPNTGNIDLVGNITMDVQIGQNGGACASASGYRWHTSYGGCRRAVQERQHQTESCGADYNGNQTRWRARTQYLLQSTGQAANDPWGAWGAWDRSACVAIPRRLPGIHPGVISKVVGHLADEYRHDSPAPPPGASRAPIPLVNGGKAYSTVYGVVLDRSAAQLRCAFAATTTASWGDAPIDLVHTWLLDPGRSIQTEHGYCQTSNNNMQIQIYGDCDSTTNGDRDECLGAGKRISIVSVSPCSATVAVTVTDPLGRWPQIRQREFSLCS